MTQGAPSVSHDAGVDMQGRSPVHPSRSDPGTGRFHRSRRSAGLRVIAAPQGLVPQARYRRGQRPAGSRDPHLPGAAGPGRRRSPPPRRGPGADRRNGRLSRRSDMNRGRAGPCPAPGRFARAQPPETTAPCRGPGGVSPGQRHRPPARRRKDARPPPPGHRPPPHAGETAPRARSARRGRRRDPPPAP